MKSKLLKIISIFMIGITCFSTALTVPVFADDVCSSSAPSEVKEAAGCNGNKNALPNIIVGILNAIIIVSSIVAVIWIVIGGVYYMTSTGDPGKIKKAKDTILYAVIGLVICALSYAIVNFTIGMMNGTNKSNNNSQNTSNTVKDNEESDDNLEEVIDDD